MTHREHLAQADRFIAECKNGIARQRESIATAYENGHSTDILVSMLRALEENLRSFERHRYLILDQLKNAWQEPHHDLWSETDGTYVVARWPLWQAGPMTSLRSKSHQ